MKKKILIIFEKSKKIGMGHYYRSLRLKGLLKDTFIVKIKELKKKKQLKNYLKNYDLFILDLKSYPILKKKEKIIIFENLENNNKKIVSINPLDIDMKNSGPKFFLFPKNLDKIKYNFNKNYEINILLIQGGGDSNSQLSKIVNFLIKNKRKIKYEFKIITKKLDNKNLSNNKNIKIINYCKDVSKIYKGIHIAISSVGNTSFELGKIGIPTIHYTVEKREINRAKIFQNKKLGIYVNKNNMYSIINELNKIYFNDNYRKKLIETRKKYFQKKNKLLSLIKNEI
jgi:spore coat polysaccharide biosynthesis predicted glycosyltransferase SpsG